MRLRNPGAAWAQRRIRREAAAPPLREGEDFVARASGLVRAMSLGGVVLFGLGGVYGLLVAPDALWTLASLAFVPLCLWAGLERDGRVLRWNETWIERRSPLLGTERHAWDDLREIERSPSLGHDVLRFADGRSLYVPDTWRGRDALAAQARARLEAREAA